MQAAVGLFRVFRVWSFLEEKKEERRVRVVFLNFDKMEHAFSPQTLENLLNFFFSKNVLLGHMPEEAHT